MTATNRQSVRSSDPRNDWIQQGRALAERLSRTRWDLGDWAASAPAGMVDDEIAERLGVSVSLIRNCRWVARRFEPERRRHELSHTHHLVVAALPPETADDLLASAVDEG